MNLRIGNGYDVHRLVPKRQFIIGGVLIPYEKGLLGHSDADVLLHSIIDSLLGASKLGDIGTLFPDCEEKYNGISSIELLKNVNEILIKKGYKIVNIDSIVIAQEPKIRPFIAQMEENVAKCLDISKDLISIKATTEEGLGFTGDLKGIASYSVCLLNKTDI